MKPLLKAAVLVLIIALTVGCSRANPADTNENITITASEAEDAFEIPIPVASGVKVEQNEKASVDYSNMHHGYVIVKYNENTDKTLRAVVTAPHEAKYIYALNGGGMTEVIPLTEGDGEYVVGIYENVEGDSYSQIISLTLNVVLDNEFAPFIHPNQFVNFTKESDLVALAAELTKHADSSKEKITAIYYFVVDNFTYDYDLAASVKSGYLPDLETVLDKKEGICFDYSALVTAMLRSQGIPTRLEIGYHGEEYHAWISIYCEEDGWIDTRYHYDGDEWSMMDPTVESGERRSHRSRQHARDDDEYRLMYNY